MLTNTFAETHPLAPTLPAGAKGGVLKKNSKNRIKLAANKHIIESMFDKFITASPTPGGGNKDVSTQLCQKNRVEQRLFEEALVRSASTG